MACIALILHVNGVPMIIIGISVYIHIHPAYILYIKDSVCIELLGVLCTPLKNIGGAWAPLAPPSYAYALCQLSHSRQEWKTQVLKNQGKWSTEDHQISSKKICIKLILLTLFQSPYQSYEIWLVRQCGRNGCSNLPCADESQYIVTTLYFYCYYTWHHHYHYNLLLLLFLPFLLLLFILLSHFFSLPRSLLRYKKYLHTHNRWCQLEILMLSFPRKHWRQC